jgi:hypothetical protein
VDTDNDAQDVYVSGNYAYVADGYGGLKVINISNPASPSIVSHVDIHNTYSVYVSGYHAYVGSFVGYHLGLTAVDISNPASPSIVATVDTDDAALDVYVSGNYVYVADYFAGLQVIDISNPASPSVVGSVYTDHAAFGVYVSGNYAYVADYSAGLKVIDISNPTSPSVVGSVYTGDYSAAVGVYVSGNYAYVAGRSAGLKVINISNPASTSIVGSVDTNGSADGVYVSGNYAYVTGYDAGLKVIDISSCNGTQANQCDSSLIVDADNEDALGLFEGILDNVQHNQPATAIFDIQGIGAWTNYWMSIVDITSSDPATVTYEPNEDDPVGAILAEYRLIAPSTHASFRTSFCNQETSASSLVLMRYHPVLRLLI